MLERSLDPKAAYAVGKFCCNDSVGGVTPRKMDYLAVKTWSTKETSIKKICEKYCIYLNTRQYKSKDTARQKREQATKKYRSHVL